MSTTPTEILETTAAAVETTLAALETTAPTIPDATAAAESALDIASIKALMDGFDPAALLPELSDIFGSLTTACEFAVMAGPVILLVLGLAYLFFSPKEANYYFGYRCYFGMGSVQAWRFTQRLAGLLFTVLGLILTIVMLVISGSFGSMEVTDMVWKALDCLIWQAVLSVAVTLGINVTAAVRFDRKGEYRRKTAQPGKTAPQKNAPVKKSAAPKKKK